VDESPEAMMLVRLLGLLQEEGYVLPVTVTGFQLLLSSI